MSNADLPDFPPAAPATDQRVAEARELLAKVDPGATLVPMPYSLVADVFREWAAGAEQPSDLLAAELETNARRYLAEQQAEREALEGLDGPWRD